MSRATAPGGHESIRLTHFTPPSGDDDYFSSDLPDEKLATVWGRVKQPIMVVPSAEDQYVPETVNFEKLLAKWKSFCPSMSDLSALIPGANHTVDAQESQDWLGSRVVSFLKSLERSN